jgi:spoIIIJ-associated protein
MGRESDDARATAASASGRSEEEGQVTRGRKRVRRTTQLNPAVTKYQRVSRHGNRGHGLDVEFEILEGQHLHPDLEDPDLLVKFSGPDVDLLLANKAELLLALEFLTMEALRMPPEHHSLLCFDSNDYRTLRIEELRLSAVTAAESVKKTRRPFHFNPMSSRERRIIHLSLRNETDIRSESTGTGTVSPGGGSSDRHAAAGADSSAASHPPPRGGPRDRDRDRGSGPPRRAAAASAGRKPPCAFRTRLSRFPHRPDDRAWVWCVFRAPMRVASPKAFCDFRPDMNGNPGPWRWPN